MNHEVGFFRLAGKVSGGDPTKGEIRVRFLMVGPKETLYERETILHLSREDALYISREWMADGSLLAEGSLLAVPNNLLLAPKRIYLLWESNPPLVHEAYLWGFVRERLSDSTYAFFPNEEEEAPLFPVDTPLPLREGSYYYLKGVFSPRFYERLSLWQNRFKALEARQILGFRRTGGEVVVPKEQETGRVLW